MVDDLQNGVAPRARLATGVLEHQHPRSEQDAGAGLEDPDRRAHESARPQQPSGDFGEKTGRHACGAGGSGGTGTTLGADVGVGGAG